MRSRHVRQPCSAQSARWRLSAHTKKCPSAFAVCMDMSCTRDTGDKEADMLNTKTADQRAPAGSHNAPPPHVSSAPLHKTRCQQVRTCWRVRLRPPRPGASERVRAAAHNARRQRRWRACTGLRAARHVCARACMRCD